MREPYRSVQLFGWPCAGCSHDQTTSMPGRSDNVPFWLAQCRVPLSYLRDTKRFVVPDLPEAPLIVFINSRSGGRAGPALTETLFHALGHSQVCLFCWRFLHRCYCRLEHSHDVTASASVANLPCVCRYMTCGTIGQGLFFKGFMPT